MDNSQTITYKPKKAIVPMVYCLSTKHKISSVRTRGPVVLLFYTTDENRGLLSSSIEALLYSYSILLTRSRLHVHHAYTESNGLIKSQSCKIHNN